MSINKDIEYNETNPNNIKNIYQSNLTVGNNNLKGDIKMSNFENKNKNDIHKKNKNRVNIDKSDIRVSEKDLENTNYVFDF